MTRRPRPTRETELGLEAKCMCCGEYFPADREFFYINKGVPHSWCIACYVSHPKVKAKQQRYMAQQAQLRAASAARIGRPPKMQYIQPPQSALSQLPRGFFGVPRHG